MDLCSSVIGGFTPGNTSFLVMNPDFHFVLAMNAIVGNVLRTSVCTSPTVLEVEVLWSEFLLLQKGQNDRIKNIVSIFYGIQCSLNNFELSASIMTNASPYHKTMQDVTWLAFVKTL
jgi:hypothetical protein